MFFLNLYFIELTKSDVKLQSGLKEKERLNHRATRVSEEILLPRHGSAEADISFLKLIDSLSGFLLLSVFRQHKPQENEQARKGVINCAHRSMVF